jgi:alkanesulfonate monooxygenase SsuD/methylene tetrahydromethanopterin reductase-like flavin-dependent oxidoreductase (luciferase family)
MPVTVKRGIYLAPFDEIVEPNLLVELAQRAEAGGWDGFFLWDHIRYRTPVRAVSDPWIALSAIATATDTLRIGPMVTPLSRRRVQKVARETVTLDHLSRGRLTLGVGLGSSRSGELAPFGEVEDARERAQLLDDGLERLTRFWDGEFEPRPVQQPRVPIWVASRWPNRRPLRRAARWDGLFPIELPDPDALTTLVDELRALRADDAGEFDLVIEVSEEDEVEPWVAAGATWVLTGFGSQPHEADVRGAIDLGPR